MYVDYDVLNYVKTLDSRLPRIEIYTLVAIFCGVAHEQAFYIAESYMSKSLHVMAKDIKSGYYFKKCSDYPSLSRWIDVKTGEPNIAF